MLCETTLPTRPRVDALYDSGDCYVFLGARWADCSIYPLWTVDWTLNVVLAVPSY